MLILYRNYGNKVQETSLLFDFPLVLANVLALFICLFFYFGIGVNFRHFGLIFPLLIAVFNYIFIKNTPQISVNQKGIVFGKKRYLWSEIAEIKIATKGNGFFFANDESTKITFKNQDVIYIYDNHYANSSEIKSFIYQIVICKNDIFEPYRFTSINKDLSSESFVEFKGNAIFSFIGIMMWGLILLALSILIFGSRDDFAIIFAFSSFSVIWFLLNSWMLHYFRISDNYFVVKNHYFFWIEKVYLLEDIEEIVFEQQAKQAKALRIITKNFQSKRFLAGSLSNRKWLEMKDFFEEKSIKVRNECI